MKSSIAEKHWKTILGIYVGVIVWSMITAQLGFWSHSLWPFRQAWYVFSRGTNYQYEIQIWGIFENNDNRMVDVSPWFKLKMGTATNRLNEMPRDEVSMKKLALYVCKKHNANPTSDSGQIERIAVLDAITTRTLGTRHQAKDLERKDIQYKYYVRNMPCPGFEEPEHSEDPVDV